MTSPNAKSKRSKRAAKSSTPGKYSLSATELLKDGLKMLGFRKAGDTVKPMFERKIKRTGRTTWITFLGGGWIEVVDSTLNDRLRLPVKDALQIVAKKIR